MRAIVISVLVICVLSILLLGCVKKEEGYYKEENITEENVTITQPVIFEFSVPSELPTAYVGKPYRYSFCNPQSEKELEGFDTRGCGVDVTPINPKGGTPPYEVTVRSKTDWFVTGVYVGGRGLLNFTPKLGDEGQYVLEVCARDSGETINDYQEICKNTTLYIMSDVVTVKGKGELNHHLLVKLKSNVKAADFAGHEVVKNITTGYLPTAGFAFEKVTAEVPAATQPCAPGVPCGGGSFASQETSANTNGVSVITEGNAACGEALGPDYPGEYNVDYYHVGYIGYADNTLIVLNITNTGTSVKAIDVSLEASSEVDSRSQNYFQATANAMACIGSDNCVSAPTGKRGGLNVNTTVLRVLVRSGSHRIDVGSMNDRLANTNTVKCPSFTKASSKVVVNIVEADMSDGKKAIGSIFAYQDGSGSGVK